MTQNQVAVSDIRTVPVGEDLTTDETRLQVLRGLETMKRVDKPLAAGATLGLGEWGVLQADGTVARATSSAVRMSFPVFCGTDRFDVKATGQVTLIMNSLIMAKTSLFDPSPTYAIGDGLVVKLVSGKSVLTKVTSTEPIVARVVELADGLLTYETVVG